MMPAPEDRRRQLARASKDALVKLIEEIAAGRPLPSALEKLPEWEDDAALRRAEAMIARGQNTWRRAADRQRQRIQAKRTEA